MSGSRADIWMPIYIGDLLGDTQHLTNEQFGIYHKIFYHQWRHGHFSDDEIAAIAGFSGVFLESASSTSQAELKQVLSRCLAPIKKMLTLDSDGLWFSRRCDQEKAKWFDKKRVFSERARKGGLAKARRIREQKEKEDEDLSASSSASSVLEGMLEPCTSPSPEVQKQDLTPPPSAAQMGPKRTLRQAGRSPRQLGTSPRQVGQAPKQLGTSARQLGTSLRQRGESPRQLGTSPRLKQKQNKGESASNAPTARPNGSDKGIHPPKGNGRRAVPSKIIANGATSSTGPPKADSRISGMKGEVLAFWKAQNPDAPPYTWTDREERALATLLVSFPDLTLSMFRRLLQNRAGSGINPTIAPYKWLRDLMEYWPGELDKFKHPVARRLM